MEVFLDFARRGRNAWWRYLVAIVLALAGSLLLTVAIILALTLSGLVSSDLILQSLSSPADAQRFFAANGLMFGLMLAAFAGAIACLHRKSPLDILGRWSWRDWTLGVALWAGVLIVLAGVDYLIAPGDFAFNGSAKTFGLLFWAGLGLLVQTFTEEYVFRGYLTQGLLLATRNPYAAALIAGLLFGGVHIPNGLPQAAAAAALGVALSLIAIRRGGIGFGAGLHFINNLFGAVALVSAVDVFKGSPALFTQNSPQLLWWDSFDVAVAVLLLAGLMDWRSRRKVEGGGV